MTTPAPASDAELIASLRAGVPDGIENLYARVVWAEQIMDVAADRLAAANAMPEPVAWLRVRSDGRKTFWDTNVDGDCTPLYASPPPAQVARDTRECTCHPDDNPPRPCPRKFALSDCRKAAAQVAPEVVDLIEQWQNMTVDGHKLVANANTVRRFVAALTSLSARTEKAEREYKIEKIHSAQGYDAASKFKARAEAAEARIAALTRDNARLTELLKVAYEVVDAALENRPSYSWVFAVRKQLLALHPEPAAPAVQENRPSNKSEGSRKNPNTPAD